jgi:O-antigen ligase
MTSLAMALIALSLIPFAVFLALKRPLIFPLGLYVMMVPFDSILGTTTTLTRLVAIATAAALLFHMIATRRVLKPPKSWTAWAAYILLASLSALWTMDSDGTAYTLGMLIQLFLFFTILATFPADRKDVHILGGIVVASGVCLSAIGLLGYETGYRTQEDRLSVSLNGLTLDPNHIAASLLLPLAIAIGAALASRDIRIKVGAAASTALMFMTLFLTGSRGGLIAASLMLLYIAWMTRYRLQVLALMAIAGVGSLCLPTVWDRFADKGLAGGSGRLFIWDVGGLAFKDHWLMGAGIGSFPSAYNHELLKTFQPVFQGWSRPAHNAYLSAAVELGILGFVLLVYAWWRTWSDARGNVVIEAAIIGLAVASYFLDVLVLKYIWLAFSMAILVKNASEPHFLRGTARPRKEALNMRLAATNFLTRRQRLSSPHPKRETILNLPT